MKLFIEISTSNKYPAIEIDNILNEEFYKIYWWWLKKRLILLPSRKTEKNVIKNNDRNTKT